MARKIDTEEQIEQQMLEELCKEQTGAAFADPQLDSPGPCKSCGAPGYWAVCPIDSDLNPDGDEMLLCEECHQRCNEDI